MNALFKFALKGSAVGAMVFLAAAAGCSDSSKDDNTGAGGDSGNKAGSSSKAGSDAKAGESNSNGGEATGNGGAPSAGANAGGGVNEGGDTTVGGVANNGDAGGPDIIIGQGGELGAGGAGTGPSVGKFCNTLTVGDGQNQESVTLVLEIGEGVDKVTFEADSETCAPADGDACMTLPQGDEVPIVLFDKAAPEKILDAGTAKILAGQNWIFFTDLDNSGAKPAPIFDGGVLKTASCESITYDDI